MTQKNKKQKVVREPKVSNKRSAGLVPNANVVETTHFSGIITKILKLEYIAEVHCWCGNDITIDSSKTTIENECPACGSPYKLLPQEWTPEEEDKYMKLKGLK